jgi:diaminohydroxyphosphoribosylaminopyrimidine deaminase/5-amino-6-(5-phosphoribosylamino)uracil reductase
MVAMDDETAMRRAMDLAERGRGLTSPNPLVGAVVVRDGVVVGEGWHEGLGTPHAEAAALAASGDHARGATVFVTLEPCDHFGRTPPCTQAIVRAGATRVVAAMRDPNPIVDGRGFATLEREGVAVRTGVLEAEARRQNAAFVRHVTTQLPLVTWKVGATFDGKVAARDGSSRWITGEAARAEVHRMRAAADAVVVGAGTALADDPALTVRDPGYRGRPVLRVLVDGSGRVPPDGELFSADAPTLVATSEECDPAAADAWRAAGAEVVVLPRDDAGGVSLGELFAFLGKRDAQSVLLEGGPTLAASAVRDGLVDRLVLFLAPKLLGGVTAPGVLGGEGLAPVDRAVRLDVVSVDRVGEDLRVEADVHRDR